tara:strand:+ start:50 stop:970 length:921 start_codon:yes stop_codon:yes gene_type:complete
MEEEKMEEKKIEDKIEQSSTSPHQESLTSDEIKEEVKEEIKEDKSEQSSANPHFKNEVSDIPESPETKTSEEKLEAAENKVEQSSTNPRSRDGASEVVEKIKEVKKLNDYKEDVNNKKNKPEGGDEVGEKIDDGDKVKENSEKRKDVKKEKEEKEEKAEEKKKKKVEEKKIVKKEFVIAKGRNLHISKKQGMYICSFIKGKKIDEAMNDLLDVQMFKRAVPFKGEIPHRKGKGMMSGRYPIKAAELFVNMLKSLKGNSLVGGLELEKTIIYSASANWGVRPARRGNRQGKRTHVILEAREIKGGKL